MKLSQRIYACAQKLWPQYLCHPFVVQMADVYKRQVESREASLELPETLRMEYDIPTTVRTVEGFTAMDSAALDALRDELGLAMDLDDLTFLQRYFRDDERREPTITEIRVVDTYWSDHCRHTTFSTHIDNVEIDDPAIQAAYRCV